MSSTVGLSSSAYGRVGRSRSKSDGAGESFASSLPPVAHLHPSSPFVSLPPSSRIIITRAPHILGPPFERRRTAGRPSRDVGPGRKGGDG